MQRLALGPQVATGHLVLVGVLCWLWGLPSSSRGPSIICTASLQNTHVACKAGTSLLNQCHTLALAFSPLRVTLFWSLTAYLACGLAWATSVHLSRSLDSESCGYMVGTLGPSPARKPVTFSYKLVHLRPGALHSLWRAWLLLTVWFWASC